MVGVHGLTEVLKELDAAMRAPGLEFKQFGFRCARDLSFGEEEDR